MSLLKIKSCEVNLFHLQKFISRKVYDAMVDWGVLRQLCHKLEAMNYELDTKVCNTQNDILKLQAIIEGITSKSSPDFKEEIPVSHQQRRVFKGYDRLEEASGDLVHRFERNMQAFKKLPPLQRDRIAHPFVSRILDFCRFTPAHYYDRMIPAATEMMRLLDGSTAKDQIVERTVHAVKLFDNTIKENGLMRQVNVPRHEAQCQPSMELAVSTESIDESFETIGNLTLKQLYEIYKTRGTARQMKTLLDMKTKTAEAIDQILECDTDDLEDEEKEQLLMTLTKAFHIITDSPRNVAIVSQ